MRAAAAAQLGHKASNALLTMTQRMRADTLSDVPDVNCPKCSTTGGSRQQLALRPAAGGAPGATEGRAVGPMGAATHHIHHAE